MRTEKALLARSESRCELCAATESLDMLYLDDDIRVWAQASGESKSEEDEVRHVDSNGVVFGVPEYLKLLKELTIMQAKPDEIPNKKSAPAPGLITAAR